MDGLGSAGDGDGVTQFHQRHVRMVADQPFELPFVLGRDLWLGSRKPVPRRDIPRLASLLQQLLHHAQRDVVPVSNLLARPVIPVIGRHNTLAKISRQSSHTPIYHKKVDGVADIAYMLTADALSQEYKDRMQVLAEFLGSSFACAVLAGSILQVAHMGIEIFSTKFRYDSVPSRQPPLSHMGSSYSPVFGQGIRKGSPMRFAHASTCYTGDQ